MSARHARHRRRQRHFCDTNESFNSPCCAETAAQLPYFWSVKAHFLKSQAATRAKDNIMKPVQRAGSIFFVSTLCLCLSAIGQLAHTAPKPAAAACAGKDMLAEFAVTDPERLRQIENAARQSKNSDAILWRIAKPGAAPSYLFGTVHLTDPRISKLSPAATSALTSASTLALEVADLSPTAMARALTGALKLALYTEGGGLKEKLSPEDFAKVERKLKSSGMPVQMAQVFRPWVVSMLLASSDCERRRASSGTPILDMQLADIAKKNGIPVVGLETLNSQLQSLSSVPNADQLAMLKVGLAYVDRSNDMIETLIQMYLKRKLGATWQFQIALAEKAGIPASAFDSFRTFLIIQRNRQMRDNAIPLIEKGGTFIAVGALHLSGKDGLVALLRKAGFDVTAVE